MADATEETPITFNIKSSSDAKYTVTVSPSITVLDLKTKLSTAEYADVSPDRQRLIYSGRVLKDNETLSSYKIKEGNTVHMVKSAPSNVRQNPASQGTPSSTGATTGTSQGQGIPGVPTNFAAGTGNDPLAGLTGGRYAGFAQLPGAGMFGPDGGMGPSPDPDQMINMLQNPQFQSTMNEALQNPQLIDMMINQNPMLRNMGPGVRQMMMSPEFRRMLTDPESLRQMGQMQRMMGGSPFGGMGGAGNSAFPAPGETATSTGEAATRDSATESATPNQTDATSPPPNPFGGAGGAAGNPFAALFGNNPFLSGAGAQNNGSQPPFNPFAMFGQPPAQTGAEGTAQSGSGAASGQTPSAGAAQNPFANLQNNPFLQNPALMQQMMQGLQGDGSQGAHDPFMSMFPHLAGGAGGSTPAPADTRPPEERYAEQLRQLNDMGFFDFDQNIEALRRTGGSVQGAIEYLLSR